MATKLSNSHLSLIMDNCNEAYIFDTYIALAHVSSMVNGKYIIQTDTDKKSHLVNILRKYVRASKRTIYNSVEKLIKLNILYFDSSLMAWVLSAMENMVRANTSKDSMDNSERSLGYVNIRSFFLTPIFSTMKARVKRLIIYMAQLIDSKAGVFYKNISMNLLKKNSPWLKILKTDNVYYARETILGVLKQYGSLFIDESSKIRDLSLESQVTKNFKFSIKATILNKRDKEKENLELLKRYNSKEYNYIKKRAKESNITITATEIMHIVRGIANIKEGFIKERVVNLLINKFIAIQIYKSREKIKSIPAYTAAVINEVINECGRELGRKFGGLILDFNDSINKKHNEEAGGGDRLLKLLAC